MSEKVLSLEISLKASLSLSPAIENHLTSTFCLWLFKMKGRCSVGDGTSMARWELLFQMSRSSICSLVYSCLWQILKIVQLHNTAWLRWCHRPQSPFSGPHCRLPPEKCCMWVVAHTGPSWITHLNHLNFIDEQQLPLQFCQDCRFSSSLI